MYLGHRLLYINRAITQSKTDESSIGIFKIVNGKYGKYERGQLY